MTRPGDRLRLFLGGDVMTGRGIDQILPQSCDPALFEDCMTSARGYVALSERVSGAIPRAVGPDYVWGDLLEDIARREVDLRLVNLQTAITSHGAHDPSRGTHYRMHPGNVALLGAARIDAVSLANNHALDWGADGLAETLTTLEAAGIAVCGAGRNQARAFAPRELPLADGGRLLLVGLALGDSGVPPSWAEGPDRPGLARTPPGEAAARAASLLAELRRFRLQRANDEARGRLAWRMDREAGRFGGRVAETPQGPLRLEWDDPRSS
ncbi:CapA family protein [Roseibacterium sp. SDUM158017]|uniref:CapA family protein n=1 Tax=Roseicyclus salinarum TaxID=3036773 RepID=UPI0024150390|nr:CapA family protein [Roseibacterium sp. SDUM158017]MDG4648193.1 CapA family protein [Roseibacterium sp. SDUM158017]